MIGRFMIRKLYIVLLLFYAFLLLSVFTRQPPKIPNDQYLMTYFNEKMDVELSSAVVQYEWKTYGIMGDQDLEITIQSDPASIQKLLEVSALHWLRTPSDPSFMKPFKRALKDSSYIEQSMRALLEQDGNYYMYRDDYQIDHQMNGLPQKDFFLNFGEDCASVNVTICVVDVKNSRIFYFETDT